ncbi:MAG TPA: SRPBCC family protein [Ktedonobacterales bacterium]|nr:SRPBCC family protein [Ktedonobacterales bacterium]
MTRIYTAATIRRPVEAVYDYVTTPGHWPEWHPSSLGVSGATDHSLAVGEQVTERFNVAGRRGTVVWTVREREAPRRWLIEGSIVGGTGGGTVAYTLTPRDDSVFFEREFVYPVPGPLLRLLDALIVRRRIQAESAEALRRLQARLEAGEAPTP